MKLLQTFGLPLLLLFAPGIFTGCGGKKLESRWRDRQITVDGRDSEWHGARVVLEDASVGLGLMNDTDHLYLTLSLTDRMHQMQVVTRGFTVWLDPHGGKNKAFGIRFPLGLQETMGQRGEDGGPPEGMEHLGGMRGGRGGRGRQQDPRQLEAMFERMLEGGMLEILDAEEQPIRRLTLAESQEIRLGIDYVNGRLVYELSVPLFADDPVSLAIGSAPGKVVGLGLEVREMDMAALRQQMGGMRGGGKGGGGGMRGGGRGGGGMRGGMAGGMMPETFQLWIKVQLAAGPEERGDAEGGSPNPSLGP